jgi:hypothetical protein
MAEPLDPKVAEEMRRDADRARDREYLETGRGTKTYQAARAYGRCGLPIFPVYEVAVDGRCACNDPDCKNVGKHPRTPDGLKDATADLDRISNWWQKWPDANVGIATGVASGLFVLDVHGAERQKNLEGKDLPTWTPRVQTDDGVQIYFAYPGGRLSSKAGICAGLDLQADGGYVLAPPSRHASGVVYEWLVPPGPLADAPTWLLDDLEWQPEKPKKRAPRRPSSDWSFEALGRQPAPQGQGPTRPIDDWSFETYFGISKPLFGSYMQTLRGLIHLADEFYEREIELLEDRFRRLEESYDRETKQLASSTLQPRRTPERLRLDSEFRDLALAIAKVITRQPVSLFGDLLTVEKPPVSSNALRMVRLFSRQCPPGSLLGDLLTIATPPVSLAAAGPRRRALVQSIRTSLAHRLGRLPSAEGSADSLSVPANEPAFRTSFASDDERSSAAERIAKRLKGLKVIHQARRRFLIPELKLLAQSHQHGLEAEGRDRIVANLFAAVEVAGAYTLAEKRKVKQALRRELNKLVAEDALGPASHRKAREVEFRDDKLKAKLKAAAAAAGDEPLPEAKIRKWAAQEAALAKAQLEARIESKLEVERRFARAGLTHAEAEVVVLLAPSGGEHGAIVEHARKLKKAPATLRGLWKRAKDKLAAVPE